MLPEQCLAHSDSGRGCPPPPPLFSLFGPLHSTFSLGNINPGCCFNYFLLHSSHPPPFSLIQTPPVCFPSISDCVRHRGQKKSVSCGLCPHEDSPLNKLFKNPTSKEVQRSMTRALGRALGCCRSPECKNCNFFSVLKRRYNKLCWGNWAITCGLQIFWLHFTGILTVTGFDLSLVAPFPPG